MLMHHFLAASPKGRKQPGCGRDGRTAGAIAAALSADPANCPGLLLGSAAVVGLDRCLLPRSGPRRFFLLSRRETDVRSTGGHVPLGRADLRGGARRPLAAGSGRRLGRRARAWRATGGGASAVRRTESKFLIGCRFCGGSIPERAIRTPSAAGKAVYNRVVCWGKGTDLGASALRTEVMHDFSMITVGPACAPGRPAGMRRRAGPRFQCALRTCRDA